MSAVASAIAVRKVMYRKTLNMMWYLAKAARAVSTATPPGGSRARP